MTAYRLHLEATIVETAILHGDRAVELADLMGGYIADPYLGAVLEAAALVGGGYVAVHDALVDIGLHEPGEGPRLFHLGPDERWLHTERVDLVCATLTSHVDRTNEAARLVHQLDHLKVAM